jgi:hypothetical protein
MALNLANRVQENATVNTTVSFTLTGAVTGYQSFAVVGNTNTTYYGATDGVNWEVGIATYSTTGPTLTRTTVTTSSNGGAAVSTFSNPVLVYVDYPAENATYSSNNPGTAGYALVSNGTGVAPSWQPVTAGAAGSTTQVQYNNAGALAGNANFTYTGNDVNIPFGPSNSATSISRVALALSWMT